MAERASVLQVVQWGVETVAGTGVAATVKAPSINIEPAVQLDMNKFSPQGSKFDTAAWANKDWVQAPITGPLSYTDVMYMWHALYGALTAPVQQAATTAYKTTYTPNQTTIDSFLKTLTIEHGDAVQAEKFVNGVVSDFGYQIDRSGATLSGNLIGQKLSTAITLTPALAYLDELEVIPPDVKVTLDATSGNLGTTALTRVFSVGFQVQSKIAPVWVLNQSTTFAQTVEQDPSTQVTIMLEADAAGMTQLTTLRAGTTQFMRILCASAQLAGTAIPYSLTHDLAVKLVGVNNFSDHEGVYAVEYIFDVVWDATWAKAHTMAIINKQVTF